MKNNNMILLGLGGAIALFYLYDEKQKKDALKKAEIKYTPVINTPVIPLCSSKADISGFDKVQTSEGCTYVKKAEVVTPTEPFFDVSKGCDGYPHKEGFSRTTTMQGCVYMPISNVVPEIMDGGYGTVILSPSDKLEIFKRANRYYKGGARPLQSMLDEDARIRKIALLEVKRYNLTVEFKEYVRVQRELHANDVPYPSAPPKNEEQNWQNFL
jgi:hypothetical protein